MIKKIQIPKVRDAQDWSIKEKRRGKGERGGECTQKNNMKIKINLDNFPSQIAPRTTRFPKWQPNDEGLIIQTKKIKQKQKQTNKKSRAKSPKL